VNCVVCWVIYSNPHRPRKMSSIAIYLFMCWYSCQRVWFLQNGWTPRFAERPHPHPSPVGAVREPPSALS
jgi:hypothetical protein